MIKAAKPGRVAVAIPVYKQFPTTAEQASFLQLLAVLGGHDLYLVVPESLATEYYGGLFGHGPRVAVERFADRYFRNIDGYNALMLSPDFYGRFSNYDYVLIYQLDAWVFKDELQYWCGQGYDYIGAPWMDEAFVRRYWSSNSRIGNWLNKIGVMPRTVGNGGFSLRKVKSCSQVLALFRKKAENWDGNEDIFWSLYVPYYFPLFRTPGRAEALHFAFETEPARCFERTGHVLPMGCHAWEKYDPAFWQPYIT